MGGEIDYYEDDDPGCCLNCEHAEEGCLCYDCKCRKCAHYYFSDFEGKGVCSLADDWRGEAEERQAEREEKEQKQFELNNPKTPQKNLAGGTVRRKGKWIGGVWVECH